MADHQLELSEKDELVKKLRSNTKLLKEKLKTKTDKGDGDELIDFYEQQLNERDELIAELNNKLSKLNDTFVDKVETKDEEINVIILIFVFKVVEF